MRRSITEFLDDQRGATALEYGLICALIVVVMLAGLSALGGSNGAMYDRVEKSVSKGLG